MDIIDGQADVRYHLGTNPGSLQFNGLGHHSLVYQLLDGGLQLLLRRLLPQSTHINTPILLHQVKHLLLHGC